MMLVAVFCDLTGSTDATRRLGAATTSAQFEQRLREVRGALSEADPSLMLVSQMGDGEFYVGREPLALFRAALTVQGQWMGLREGLPARITFAYGEGVWSGPEWTEKSTVRGTFIDFASRLLTVCPVGGIVVNGGMYAALSEVPEVRERLHERRAVLRGLGEQAYWVVNGGNLSTEPPERPETLPEPPIARAATHRRRSTDRDDVPDGAGVDLKNRRAWVHGAQTITIVCLITLVLFYAGAFRRWNIEPRDANADLIQQIQTRIKDSKREHDTLIQGQAISHYLLAECLRRGGDCPKLTRPPGLEEKVRRPQ